VVQRDTMMAKEPTENISITVPIFLKEIIDYLCLLEDLNRTQFVTRAIKSYVCQMKAKDLSFWESEYKRMQEEGKI